MKYFIKTILCATRPNKKIWIFLLLVVSGYLKGYAQENGLLPETPVLALKQIYFTMLPRQLIWV